ncbi:transglycosylase SLT domain-containing protein [Geoalkalibacter subterraneus]|uniref:Transglycosylase SLT domain-containing protein n=1 Tax=Geoalkalibacter subterraneus TaxID=483547 RepID=A0A0B5FUG2_9BACT|nr:transglycosylase SLT domain-containing protein [Geoalkalibacter subterraneus]AJF08284.1 hypothetical protein GSUB_17565 [Geoalkalibacter subterraneus]
MNLGSRVLSFVCRQYREGLHRPRILLAIFLCAAISFGAGFFFSALESSAQRIAVLEAQKERFKMLTEQRRETIADLRRQIEDARVRIEAMEAKRRYHASLVDRIMESYYYLDKEYVEQIVSAAISTGEPELVLSVAMAESSLRHDIVSHKGAIGLTGIIPRYWNDELQKAGIIEKPSDYYSPAKNLAACKHILDLLRQRFDGDLVKALRYYNGGSPGVHRYAQCLAYAQKVISHKETFLTLAAL